MKQTSIQISVPEPCDQPWHEMQVVNDGRYCNQCSRTLIDFSQMTDRELVHFLQQNQGKICGRFHRDQLEKSIPLQAPQPNRSIFNSIGLAFTGLLTSVSGMGQTTLGAPMLPVVEGTHLEEQGFITLKGRVLNGEGNALIGAVVAIEHTEIKADTDFDGQFLIEGKLPADAHMKVRFIGYEPVTIKVADYLANSDQQIILKDFEQYSEAHIVGYMVPGKISRDQAPQVSPVQERVVEGKVIDGESGEPLIGASLLIEGTQRGTVTDFEGLFTLKVPADFTEEEVSLMVAFIGYEPHYISLKVAELPKRQLTVIMETNMLTGEMIGIVVVNKATYPSTLVQWIKDLTYRNSHKRQQRKVQKQARRDEKKARKANSAPEITAQKGQDVMPHTCLEYPWKVKAFPNPFSEFLQLELQLQEAMKIHLRLVNLNGQVLWADQCWLEAGTQQWTLNPRELQLEPGTYYWQIEGRGEAQQVLPLVYTSKG